MSSEDTGQYRMYLSKLPKEDLRPGALNDIKNLFVLKPPVEVANTLKTVGITEIVRCLDVNQKAHIDLACDVLQVCFEKFSVGEVVKSYTGHIMYLLRHEKDCVRRLAINEVYKAVVASPSILPVAQYIDVFIATAQMVADKDVGVATKAIHITSNISDDVMYPKILEEMKIALDGDSSSKCNAFEVIVNISTKSYNLFKLSADYGYIDVMIKEIESNDVLYQLNILELLSRLVVTPHGMNYLVKHGVIQTVSNLANGLKTNSVAGLLTPGYMKFLGCITHHYPNEIFKKHPALLDLVFESLESPDDTFKPVALDTLGFIGVTIEGKLCLAALGSKYTQSLEKIGQIIKTSPTELKVRGITCLANLVSIDQDPKKPVNGPVDHRVTLMTREWFRTLSLKPTAMEMLFFYCKNPFVDIKLAAFTLLDAVSQHQWGEELVARTAGFVEYLLDRSINHTKEAKEVKYDIIKRLSHSPAFDSTIVSNLLTYVEKGPFYSEPTLEVAMDEGD